MSLNHNLCPADTNTNTRTHTHTHTYTHTHTNTHSEMGENTQMVGNLSNGGRHLMSPLPTTQTLRYDITPHCWLRHISISGLLLHGCIGTENTQVLLTYPLTFIQNTEKLTTDG